MKCKRYTGLVTIQPGVATSGHSSYDWRRTPGRTPKNTRPSDHRATCYRDRQLADKLAAAFRGARS